jgi:hypothetical protein
MRSNSGAASRRSRSGESLSFVASVHTMPRSMRSTASSPHTFAMSVALLDQGEIVPKRGTTITSAPCTFAVAASRGP